MKVCVKYCSRLSDVEMEAEIARLEASPHVKLARMHEAVREARQQYMFELLKLEHKGLSLEEQGVTAEALERFANGAELYDRGFE